MKEKILDAFKQLGFSLIKTDEMGYGFSCEGTNLLYIPNSEDEDFLNISVPCVCDGESGRSMPLQDLAERINAMLKYVKAYRLGKTLWLFYERELLSEENLPQIISRMVVRLEAANCFVHYFLVANGNVQANIETGISKRQSDNMKNKKSNLSCQINCLSSCRGSGIRTHDPLLPKQVR